MATMVFARSQITIVPSFSDDDPVLERQPIIRLSQPIVLPVEIHPASAFQTPTVYLSQALQGNETFLVPLISKTDFEPQTALTETISADDLLFPIPKSKPIKMRHAAPLLETESANRHALNPANVYAPVDILAINAEGAIVKIWPSIILANLQAPLALPPNSKAVLYMASGRAMQLGILPKDRVMNDLFTPPPIAIE